MHRIMGSTDESTVEQLRELYLARVREVHPDTRDEDAPEIEIDEIKEIYDKLLERRVEQEETGYVDLTIEDYRAGVHHKKPKFHHYFYSNAMRFWIAIPVLTVLTEKSYDIATGMLFNMLKDFQKNYRPIILTC